MSTVTAVSVRNGVDTAKLFATLDAVKAQPEAARFRFSVDNRWISGTHNQNRKRAASGCALTASSVANSLAVSTPLRRVCAATVLTVTPPEHH